MIVAVAAMGMVEVAIDQVIDVIPVWYCLVTAVLPVSVRLIMSGTVVAWCAFLRVHRVHLNAVFVHMPIMRMVHVPIVKIVRVAIVLHGSVATIWPMLVPMIP